MFFSSHALYSPNTKEAFRSAVIEKNRFEWRKKIPADAGKAIFLRDVQKQWYLEGINRNTDCIEKICNLIQAETSGHEVICVGSSAGGYIATLVGTLIGAARVFSFSGQFNLWPILKEKDGSDLNPVVSRNANNPAISVYYSVPEFLARSQTPVFYTYPTRSLQDTMQSGFVEKLMNVYSFKISSSKHDIALYKENLTAFLQKDPNHLFRIYEVTKGKTIHPIEMSLRIQGISQTLKIMMSKLRNRIRKGNA